MKTVIIMANSMLENIQKCMTSIIRLDEIGIQPLVHVSSVFLLEPSCCWQ